jgi:hypothetical protein
MIHDAADIDTILVAAKRIAGQPAWLRGSGAKGERSEIASFRAQLEVDGIIRTDVAIAGNAHVFLPVQPVTLVLICGQRPVERLDLSPRTSHVNPVRAGLPAELSGLVLQPVFTTCIHGGSIGNGRRRAICRQHSHGRRWTRSPARFSLSSAG